MFSNVNSNQFSYFLLKFKVKKYVTNEYVANIVKTDKKTLLLKITYAFIFGKH